MNAVERAPLNSGSFLDIQPLEGYWRFLGWEESEPRASILASTRFRAAIWAMVVPRPVPDVPPLRSVPIVQIDSCSCDVFVLARISPTFH
jgi:hypothetical protein